MTQRNTLTTETRFRCIERKSMLLRLCCECVEGTKKTQWKMTKSMRVYEFIHLSRQPPPPGCAPTLFCIRGWTMDVIKHVKFQLNRFGGFGAHWAEYDPPPFTSRIALTTAYAISCDNVIISKMAEQSCLRQSVEVAVNLCNLFLPYIDYLGEFDDCTRGGVPEIYFTLGSRPLRLWCDRALWTPPHILPCQIWSLLSQGV